MCKPASLLGKVLGKDILDNGSRCCQYSVLLFLSSATCFCSFPAGSELRALPAVPRLLSQQPHAALICFTSALLHISITLDSLRKPCPLIRNAEHLKNILYLIKHFISLFMQVSGQISSFCRHKKIFFA